jgi:GT2 family glycosyltransferase
MIDALPTPRSQTDATEDSESRVSRFAPSNFSASVNPTLLHAFESLVMSRSGGVMIVGWIVDADAPIDRIRVVGREWSVTFEHTALARVRRRDVEESLGIRTGYSFGYFGFVFVDEQIDPNGDFKIEICLKSGWITTVDVVPTLRDDSGLRDLVLSYLAAVEHFGNQQVGGVTSADSGLGAEIVVHSRSITDRIVASPYVERFGPRTRKHIGSIIVCLYGKMEYIFLQNCLFSQGPGIKDYEFIYICNSPELAESLLGEARISSRIYDIDQTIVILPGNAGFGGANNAAVNFAQTGRLLIMNPDVFPYDLDWAEKHTTVVNALPQEQTKLFGAPLYYDNGSLMHGGMYFEIDKGPSRRGDRTVEWQLARVEHYGKGAPADAARFLRPRPVPAVTGAFISCDRPWFEQLGGFTEDYVFGHYEDADLCLKSIQAGTAPWLHDIKLWHLEGHGSTRLPVHEGGSIVNRWLFSANWGPYISANLLGPNPQHPAFHGQTVLHSDHTPPQGGQTGAPTIEETVPAKPRKATAKLTGAA